MNAVFNSIFPTRINVFSVSLRAGKNPIKNDISINKLNSVNKIAIKKANLYLEINVVSHSVVVCKSHISLIHCIHITRAVLKFQELFTSSINTMTWLRWQSRSSIPNQKYLTEIRKYYLYRASCDNQGQNYRLHRFQLPHRLDRKFSSKNKFTRNIYLETKKKLIYKKMASTYIFSETVFVRRVQHNRACNRRNQQAGNNISGGHGIRNVIPYFINFHTVDLFHRTTLTP